MACGAKPPRSGPMYGAIAGPTTVCEPDQEFGTTMQKIVTIQMKAKDGELQEHLAAYTNDGWRVVSVAAAGAGQDTYRSFLIAVVLEKP
jgi:hypothetical protein